MLPPENTVPVTCRHSERHVIGRSKCDSCAGNVIVFIFDCNLFQRCTLKKKIEDIPTCKDCEHWELP